MLTVMVVLLVIRLDYVPYMKEILLQKLLAGDEARERPHLILRSV